MKSEQIKEQMKRTFLDTKEGVDNSGSDDVVEGVRILLHQMLDNSFLARGNQSRNLHALECSSKLSFQFTILKLLAEGLEMLLCPVLQQLGPWNNKLDHVQERLQHKNLRG